MKTLSIFMVMGVMVWSTCAAWAAEVNCSGTQHEMNLCSKTTWANEDAQLNRWYEAALGAAEDEQARELLRASQRSWLVYRDARCAVEADVARGGSMAPALKASCLTQLTRQRVVELRGSIADPFGGILGWPEDLASLLQLAGDTVPENVFWHPKSMVSADFDQDGAYDTAVLGVLPGDLMTPDSTYFLLVHASGAQNVVVVEIPVGDDGLCSPSASLDIDFSGNDQPYLIVDDGACDVYRFWLQKDQKTLQLHRN